MEPIQRYGAKSSTSETGLEKSESVLRFNIHGLLPLDNGPKTCKMKKQYFLILF
jgi:hypothetical protein